ncbi:MAG: SLC13 family permease [bacterium]|jgi:sodium-dependent dicarboxylate transporter 2/3/5|nr:SLC13 family permease [bacterium]
MKKYLKLILCLAVPLLVWIIPTEWIPIQNLSVIEHRVIALFVMAAIFWVLEPIPVYATSVLIITLELLILSDKCFILFKENPSVPNFGQVLDHRDIMATFASPIILLFLGGFFLAMAATKYRLDINLARVMLKPFGQRPTMIMLGLMIITAFFSMFMSNTATTAMMLAIVMPVLNLFDEGDRGKVGLLLSIPFAANIGGIGTPIGTPPNAIALKYLVGADSISFGAWMAFATPYMIGLLLILWFLFTLMFPFKTKEVNLEIKSQFLTNWKAITVYATFGITIVLWLLGSYHGMNSYVVGMIPVVVFTVTQIINREDLKRISWDVLWLVSGGIALGFAMEESKLSIHLIESIPFATFPPFVILLACTGVTFALANFMSHTATANLILPIVAALGANLTILEPMGGGKMLILATTIASSLSMALPISTPPNAIAYSSGIIQTKDMYKIGLLIGILGLIACYGLMYILNLIGFF